jgi:E3 ubiquitin-protein ligase BRE1
LRAQLAVDTRDADLMKFILNMNTEDASYVADLKARLEYVASFNSWDQLSISFVFSVSEAKVAAFEQSLSKLRKDNPIVAQHIEAESQARQQLIEITNRLEAYQNVYGQSSTLPPDVQALSEQLQQKELELEKLRLQDLRHVEVCRISSVEDSTIDTGCRLRLPCTQN